MLRIETFHALTRLAINHPNITSFRISSQHHSDLIVQITEQSLRGNTTVKNIMFENMKLTRMGLEALTRILNHNRALTVLHLNHMTFEDDASSLYRALRITNLVIANMALTQKEFNELCSVICWNPRLEDLNFINVNLQSSIKHITQAVRANRSIGNLQLFKCNIGDYEAVEISDLLIHNTSLITIDLRRNPIGIIGTMAIGLALTRNSTLQSLSLWGSCQQQTNVDSIFEVLGRALTNKIWLRRLIIDEHRISPLALDALMNKLAFNQSIRYLWFQNSNLKNVKYISRMLSINTRLVELNLSNNEITCQDLLQSWDDCPSLMQILETNPNLKILSLSKNKLVNHDTSNETCAMFMSSLARAPYLRTLNLDECHFSSHIWNYVPALISSNTSLKILNLSNNPATARQVQECINALVFNTCLQQLNLPYVDQSLYCSVDVLANSTMQKLMVGQSIFPFSKRNYDNAILKTITLVQLLLNNSYHWTVERRYHTVN